MPSFHNAFPSKYLKVSDLNGRTIPASIATIDFQTVGSENKYVVQFNEIGLKPLALNKTNCQTIADIVGSDDVVDWEGVRIELYPSQTEFQGKRVACIRVRAPKQARPARAAVATATRRAAPPSAPDHDDVDDAMPTADGGEY